MAVNTTESKREKLQLIYMSKNEVDDTEELTKLHLSNLLPILNFRLDS